MGFEVTPTFLMQYERTMRTLRENSYFSLLADDSYWASKILKPTDIERKTERVAWLLNTATIKPIGKEGSGGMDFQGMVTQSVEYPTFKHGVGTRVNVDQLEDLDGTGLEELGQWASDVGHQTAYYPQKLTAQFILNGANTDGTATAYDGMPFFLDNNVAFNPNAGATAGNGHPYNPYQLNLGGYYNWLHGAAVSASAGVQYYPGALPIDDSVTADVALKNIGIALAYVRSIKQANGQDPRNLKSAFILAPPRMSPRLNLLLKARQIALQAAGGAGSADIQGVVSGFGLGEPLIAAELGANYSYSSVPMPFVATGGSTTSLPENLAGNDTSWYIVTRENLASMLGGIVHVRRKPFAIRYFGEGGQSVLDAMLSRQDYIEYQCKGRMSVQPGHPFGIFRIDAS